MSQYKPTIPHASLLLRSQDTESVSIDWDKIEQACNGPAPKGTKEKKRYDRKYVSISAMARDEIMEKTHAFVRQFQAIKHAETIDRARARILLIRKRSAALQRAIGDTALWGDVASFTDPRLNRQYHAIVAEDSAEWDSITPLRKFAEDAAALALEAPTFVEACDLQLRSLDRRFGIEGRQPSDIWNDWICAVTDSCDNHSIPTGASKDASSKDSKFVLLIDALQRCLPRGSYKRRPSLIALAGAIKRARNGS